jgi:hypothetical protein
MRNKWIVSVSVIVFWLTSLLSNWQMAGAGGLQMSYTRTPPAPTSTPPKPTWTPVPRLGAPLKLRVEGSHVAMNLWTVVQWQNENKQWYDVEGWRGTLDQIEQGVGRKDWWVDQANFGQVPFRWQLYQSLGGKLLATSAAFDLPTSPRLPVVIVVAVTLPAH